MNVWAASTCYKCGWKVKLEPLLLCALLCIPSRWVAKVRDLCPLLFSSVASPAFFFHSPRQCKQVPGFTYPGQHFSLSVLFVYFGFGFYFFTVYVIGEESDADARVYARGSQRITLPSAFSLSPYRGLRESNPSPHACAEVACLPCRAIF